MKQNIFKRIALSMALLLLCAALCASFAACGKKTITILFVDGDKVESLEVNIKNFDDDATIYDLLLKESETMQAEMSGEDTDLVYLSGIHGMHADSSYQYIAIYHSIESLATQDKTTITVGGNSYYYSGVGIKELTLVEGATYLFCLEEWRTPGEAESGN